MSGGTESSTVGKLAIKTGIFSVALAAVFYVGCLGYYGSGLSSEPSVLTNVKTGSWPAEVRSRLQTFYLYYFLSLYLCVLSAACVYSNPGLSRLFAHPVMMVVDFVVQTLIQGGKAFASLSNERLLSKRRAAWVAYCMFVGAKGSPSLVYGAEAARIAVHLTCLLMFALISLSISAPVEKFVLWGDVLNVCEIVIFVSSVASSIFPVRTTPGIIFFAINLYGGLILYPADFLRHSQETHIAAGGDMAEADFCGLAFAVPMILDIISIFSRVVSLIPPS